MCGMEILSMMEDMYIGIISIYFIGILILLNNIRKDIIFF